MQVNSRVGLTDTQMNTKNMMTENLFRTCKGPANISLP